MLQLNVQDVYKLSQIDYILPVPYAMKHTTSTVLTCQYNASITQCLQNARKNGFANAVDVNCQRQAILTPQYVNINYFPRTISRTIHHTAI